MISNADQTWVGGGCLLLTSSIFVAWGGFLGVFASAMLAILLYRYQSMYATVFGHFALVALGTDYGVLQLALVEVGLIGVLISPSMQADHVRTLLPRLFAAICILGGITYAGLSWYDSTLSAVVLCLGTFGVAAYSFDWYDRTTLDVVGDNV